jgi:hypothetical protein
MKELEPGLDGRLVAERGGLADEAQLFRFSRNNIDFRPKIPNYFAFSEIFRFLSHKRRLIS